MHLQQIEVLRQSPDPNNQEIFKVAALASTGTALHGCGDGLDGLERFFDSVSGAFVGC